MTDWKSHFAERDTRKAYDNSHRYLAFGALVGFVCGLALAVTYLGGVA